MKFIKCFGLFFHGLFCQKLPLGPFVICKSMYFFFVSLIKKKVVKYISFWNEAVVLF